MKQTHLDIAASMACLLIVYTCLAAFFEWVDK